MRKSIHTLLFLRLRPRQAWGMAGGVVFCRRRNCPRRKRESPLASVRCFRFHQVGVKPFWFLLTVVLAPFHGRRELHCVHRNGVENGTLYDDRKSTTVGFRDDFSARKLSKAARNRSTCSRDIAYPLDAASRSAAARPSSMSL